MEYIFGTTYRNGLPVENLKTVGSEPSDLSGYIEVRREYDDGTVITDRCRIVQHYQSLEANGRCYDWYIIDNHNRNIVPSSIKRLEETTTDLRLALAELAEALLGGV